jgi:hypothetical protein
LPLKRGDNLKIQKVLSSEKIQNVDLNVEKECNFTVNPIIFGEVLTAKKYVIS